MHSWTITKTVSGIFHFSGDKDINYYDFMQMCNKYLYENGKKFMIQRHALLRRSRVRIQRKQNMFRYTKTEKMLDIKPFSLLDSMQYYCDKISRRNRAYKLLKLAK